MTLRVNSAEIARNFAEYREKAETEPVLVMHYNKPSVVVISAEEYARLRRRDEMVTGRDFREYLLSGPFVDEFSVERDRDTGATPGFE